MCFSTSVSFAAGTLLCITGVITLKQVKHPSQYLFAAIPLLFGAQQFAEGFVWLSLTHPGYSSLTTPATAMFLFIAQVIWPAWVPIAILKLEKNPMRKKILIGFSITGVLISCYLASCLFIYPFHAKVMVSHIQYQLDFPLAFVWLSGLMYFVPSVFSPMISSNKKVPLLGIATMISYIFTNIFYENYLISVWCFFAAVISAWIWHIITEMNRPVAGSVENVKVILP